MGESHCEDAEQVVLFWVLLSIAGMQTEKVLFTHEHVSGKGQFVASQLELFIAFSWQVLPAGEGRHIDPDIHTWAGFSHGWS